MQMLFCSPAGKKNTQKSIVGGGGDYWKDAPDCEENINTQVVGKYKQRQKAKNSQP